MKSEKEERGAVSIQRDQLQYELEAWKRMWEEFGGELCILTICSEIQGPV
jgi:hypothetical protein